MRLTSATGRVLTTGVMALALFAGSAVAVAAPVGTGAGDAAESQGSYARLHPLAELSARRLATADLVAAAKYGTGSPIDDAAREKQVLDAVARAAREAGGDPEATVRIFRDQIEANKVVQRELFRRWDATPSQVPQVPKVPQERPDLAEVREEINRINTDLVRGIAASAGARTAPSCGGVLTAATVHVRHTDRLDALHALALGRALRSVCAP
ncbi:gamma subclass chorismate mutase AroQ [Streptomyces sp. NPDC018584]|uniref:gamma subclass chorismate mutase AroQ n=1 Tax=unclassified Streptomyces TaxID=2593676 RepID=UPI0037967160